MASPARREKKVENISSSLVIAFIYLHNEGQLPEIQVQIIIFHQIHALTPIQHGDASWNYHL
jgi:hypothetical protein